MKILTQRPNKYVYVLKAGPYYKIGYSKDVERRICQLSTLPPFDLEIIYIMGWHDAVWLEAALHHRFRHRRVRGEWFELDSEDLDVLEGVVLALGRFNITRTETAKRLKGLGIKE